MGTNSKNPFTPNQPAQPSLFVGRKIEIESFERCLRQTSAGNPSHIFVSGQRGVGKSSFANYLKFMSKNDKEGIDFILLRFSFSGVQTLDSALKLLVEEMWKQVASKRPYYSLFKAINKIVHIGIGPFSMTRSRSEDEGVFRVQQLIKWMAKLNKVSGQDKVIIFIIDEIDRFPELEKFSEFFKYLIEALQMNESILPVQFILLGMPEAQERFYKGHPSVMRVMTPIRLERLKKEEAVDLVFKALSESDVSAGITSTAMDLIIHWSDCYPYFIQHIAFSCCEVDTDATIGEDDFISAMVGTDTYSGSIALLKNQLFDNMFGNVIDTEESRDILFAIIDQSSAELEYVKSSKLNKTVGVDYNEFYVYLEQMIQEGIVERHPLISDQIRVSNKLLWIYLRILRNEEKLPKEIRNILSIAPNLEIEKLKNREEYSAKGVNAEASILFADIVGFTSLSESLPILELTKLSKQVFSIMAEAIKLNGGKVEKMMGDVLLAKFFTTDDQQEYHAIRAVQAALNINDTMKNAETNSEYEKIGIRISVHTGKVTINNGVIFGDNINIAARMSMFAKPDEIVVSNEVKEKCDSKFNMLEIGEFKMKEKDDPFQMFKVDLSGQHIN